MQAQMPGACAPHRETAQHRALQINQPLTAEQPFDRQEVRDRLVNVGFAGPAVGVIAAAVDVELHVGTVGDFPVAVVGVQELDFGETGIAAVQDHVPAVAWWLLVANVFWSLAYDTEYAMVDRDDDLIIGIRTSAITFGRYDVAAIMVCYAATLGIDLVCGWSLGLRWWFVAGIAVAAGMAVYHYTLIRGRDRMKCFAAFNHNNWLGAAVFAGVALDYALG